MSLRTTRVARGGGGNQPIWSEILLIRTWKNKREQLSWEKIPYPHSVADANLIETVRRVDYVLMCYVRLCKDAVLQGDF
jgi:hypothetical protein